MAPFRKILHIDLDAFFCSVEEKLNPSLKGQAFAVGGPPEERGVVTSCSYAARKFGIRSAMPMIKAIKFCPALKVVGSHYAEYQAASKDVMKILKSYTPLFEQISIDEAFIDISDLVQPGFQIAREIQSRIFQELSLPCSIGVATNKLVAKIATNVGKSRNRGSTPMAIIEVKPGQEKTFLAPLPIEEMWGIGPKTALKMRRYGIMAIGDVVKKTEKEMEALLGKYGRILHQHANGIDRNPVVADDNEIKSISNELTFFMDIDNESELLSALTSLCIKVGYRLRKKQLSGSSIKLKIRWPDFETQTRQLTLSQPANQDTVIISSAKKLFYQIWKKGMKVRLIGVGISQLSPDFQQLSLLDQKDQREKHLLKAIDELHQKYGEKALMRGFHKTSFHPWKD